MIALRTPIAPTAVAVAFAALAAFGAPPPLEPLEASGISAVVRQAGARAVLVNVWASWCQPCREEFPGLLRVGREWKDRGLALVLISADFDEGREAAARFLQSQGVDFRSYVRVGGDEPFIDALSPEWTGALPASFVFDAAGHLRAFHQGQLTPEELRTMVRGVLDPAGPRPGTEEPHP